MPGNAEAAYHTPLKTDKTPAKFLKAKPTTAMVLCEHCGLCAKICPMGAIDLNDPSHIPGTCIKCCACTTHCPSGAKKFDDPDFCRTPLCSRNSGPNSVRRMQFFSKALP